MGPCTDQSRKSIHCIGRKRCIFAHFALKILLTARSNGTITNNIAVLKRQWWWSKLVPMIHLHSFLATGGLCLWISACCTGTRWVCLSLNHPTPNQSPMSSQNHSYWVNCKSPPFRHLLFPWQSSADNLHWGLLWVDGWEEGISPLLKASITQGKNTWFSVLDNKATRPSKKMQQEYSIHFLLLFAYMLIFCLRSLLSI